MAEKIRIDKYLWSVRLFKTRSIAIEACKSHRVKINGEAVKPSFLISAGDIFTIRNSAFEDIYQVKEVLKKRVSAKLVAQYLDYLISDEELARRRYIREKSFEKRERGVGRPTKKQRREIENLKKV